MKKMIFMLLALVMTVMTASAADVPTYDLTVGTSEHGTITFKVGENSVTKAAEGETVTVTVTPAEDYDVDEVTGTWYAAVAATRATASIDLLKVVDLTAGENAWTFTMQRANAEISVKYAKKLTSNDITEGSIAPVTYSGSALKPAVTLKDGDKVLKEGVDFTVDYVSNTDAGTGTIIITGIGDYSGTLEIPFTINKADATVTAPTAKSGLVASGKAQELINAGSAEGGEIQYSLDGTNYSTALPTGTDGQEYTVYYKVVGDKNHNDVAAKSITVVINKDSNTGLAFLVSEAVAVIGEANEFPSLSNPFGLPVEWISKNEDVATVDQSGKVTLVGPGEAEIWVVFKGNSRFQPVSARYRLSVVQKPAAKSGTGLAFYYEDEKVDKGWAKFGEPLKLPRLSNPYSLEVEWLSTNTEVATVDQDGRVTLVGPGMTEIWIVFRGNDRFDSVAAVYRLTVEGQPEEPEEPEEPEDPTAVKTVKTDAQVVGVRKYVRNGKVVIETPNGIFSLSGAQIK